MTVVYIVSGTSWTVPSDWNSADNTIECIGGGGAGHDGSSSSAAGAGAGGGAYAKKNNVALTPGVAVTVQVGTGGATSGANGTATFVQNNSSVTVVSADFGVGAPGTSAGGAGGLAANCTGDTTTTGGTGGAASGSGGMAGGGGGGAAGPNGVGQTGGAAGISANGGAGGGGGNGGGSAGSPGAATNPGAGGNGGNNSASSGAGTGGNTTPSAGTAGTSGGGGGGGGAGPGATPADGGTGGNGIEWDASHGSGGGGGGGGRNSAVAGAPGNGGLYGAGGGGSNSGNSGFGTGAQGIIVATYTPSSGGTLVMDPLAYNLDVGSSTATYELNMDPLAFQLALEQIQMAGPNAGRLRGAGQLGRLASISLSWTVGVRLSLGLAEEGQLMPARRTVVSPQGGPFLPQILNAVLPGGEVGLLYLQHFGATGGTPPYTWSLASASPNTGSWLEMSPAGILNGIPGTAETEAIVVKVTDSLGLPATRAYSIPIAAPVSIATPSPLAGGTVGVSYSQQVTAANGVPPYVFSLQSASPDTGSWVSVSPTGFVAGTPVVAETENVTVLVTDNLGGVADRVFVLPVTGSAGQMPWHPGDYWEMDGIGFFKYGPGTFPDISRWTGIAQTLMTADTNNSIVGFVAVFDFSQVEGATLGDYSAWFATVTALVEFCQANGKQLMIEINLTGNVSHAAVPAYMLNNVLYGQVQSGTGYQGGLFSGPSAGRDPGNVQTVRYDIPATMARVAAAGKALYVEFGSAVYGLNFLYSEAQNFNNFVPQMTSGAITSTIAGSGGLMDQIRGDMPKTYLMASLSYMNQSDFQTLFAAMDRNYISLMIFDFTNDAPVRTGGNSAQINSVGAFRGGSYSGTTFVPGYSGLIDRRALVPGGGRDCCAHVGPDELGNRPPYSQPVPPAHAGDGTLGAILAQEVLMQNTHRILYPDGYTGPKCNTKGTYVGQPANYTNPPYQYTGWGDLQGFYALNPVPNQAYPASSFWPH